MLTCPLFFLVGTVRLHRTCLGLHETLQTAPTAALPGHEPRIPLSFALLLLLPQPSAATHTISRLVQAPTTTTPPNRSGREGPSGDFFPNDLHIAGIWPACSDLESSSPSHHYSPVPTRGLSPFAFSLMVLKPWSFAQSLQPRIVTRQRAHENQIHSQLQN